MFAKFAMLTKQKTQISQNSYMNDSTVKKLFHTLINPYLVAWETILNTVKLIQSTINS